MTATKRKWVPRVYFARVPSVIIGLVIVALVVFMRFGAGDPSNQLETRMRKALDQDDVLQVRAIIRQSANPNMLVTMNADRPVMVRLRYALSPLFGSYDIGPEYRLSALSYAVVRCRQNETRELLNAGANPNVIDIRFYGSPINFAAAANDAQTVRLLMSHGANPRLLGSNKMNAILSAQRNKNSVILRLLR